LNGSTALINLRIFPVILSDRVPSVKTTLADSVATGTRRCYKYQINMLLLFAFKVSETDASFSRDILTFHAFMHTLVVQPCDPSNFLLHTFATSHRFLLDCNLSKISP
jgi:hypothetical protein